MVTSMIDDEEREYRRQVIEDAREALRCRQEADEQDEPRGQFVTRGHHDPVKAARLRGEPEDEPPPVRYTEPVVTRNVAAAVPEADDTHMLMIQALAEQLRTIDRLADEIKNLQIRVTQQDAALSDLRTSLALRNSGDDRLRETEKSVRHTLAQMEAAVAKLATLTTTIVTRDHELVTLPARRN
jgi:hypothetical protein